MRTIIWILLLISTSDFKMQSNLFQEYLSKYHHSKLSNQNIEYYVIRENNCYKCYTTNLALAKKALKKKNVRMIYVYNRNARKTSDNLNKSSQVLLDSIGAFNQININPFSDCIIYTSNGKIKNIKQLTNE